MSRGSVGPVDTGPFRCRLPRGAGLWQIWAMGWGWRNRTRADADQGAIVRLLRRAGASVSVIGHPLDLLVGWQGVTLLVEVKQAAGPRGGTSQSGQRLRESQAKFVESWRGSPPLVVSAGDALAVISAECERLRK